MACIAVRGSCLLLTGYAGPVPDGGAYRRAALQTSMAMVSDLASAQLAARFGLRGSSFPAFTDGNVTNAENDAGSVNSTFSSRQPPDARSDALRQKMLQALSDGTSALTDLREITLLTRRENLDSYRFRQWTEEKVIGRIPGSTK